MTRKRAKKRELRTLAAPFTVAAPPGARIRERLRLPAADAEALRLVGRHLGHHAWADLAERVRLGDVKAKDNQRAARKKALTAVSSSRWAGAMTRASEDQYQLSKRALYDERAMLRRAIRVINNRLAVPCGQRRNGVRGYPNQADDSRNSAACRHSQRAWPAWSSASPPAGPASWSAAVAWRNSGTTSPTRA
ncbi:hypothetical protein [Streptomyces mirabilis]|uniref:hypothetical protein n=1 Tax=Streptomyces mirabilis TaxID=68239 RepID=UPI003317CA13